MPQPRSVMFAVAGLCVVGNVLLTATPRPPPRISSNGGLHRIALRYRNQTQTAFQISIQER